MSQPELRITKQAVIARGHQGSSRTIDLQLKPDSQGIVAASLEGGTRVQVNCQSRKVTIVGLTKPQVTRTYDVGHPSMSGKKTKIQLEGIMVGLNMHRVTLDLNRLAASFPDGQSRLTIKASGSSVQSVTLS